MFVLAIHCHVCIKFKGVAHKLRAVEDSAGEPEPSILVPQVNMQIHADQLMAVLLVESNVHELWAGEDGPGDCIVRSFAVAHNRSSHSPGALCITAAASQLSSQ